MLINRLPTKLLSWKTFYELLFGTSLEYTSLKVFGCLCLATNTHPHKNKLEPRANSSIFLRHQIGFKNFKVYDLVNKKLIITRDVVFHESKFLFLDSYFKNTFYDSASLPLLITTYLHSDLASQSIATVPSQLTATDVDATTLQARTSSLSSGNDFPTPLIRRNNRPKKQPPWMFDFITNQISISNLFDSSLPIEPAISTLSSLQFSVAHINFFAKLTDILEPRNYAQVCKSLYWFQAIQDELSALEKTLNVGTYC